MPSPNGIGVRHSAAVVPRARSRQSVVVPRTRALSRRSSAVRRLLTTPIPLPPTRESAPARRIILLLSRPPPLLPVSRHGHCIYTLAHCTDDGRRSAYALRDCNYLQHGTGNALSLPTARPPRTDRPTASQPHDRPPHDAFVRRVLNERSHHTRAS